MENGNLPQHTALQCLTLIARHHGIQISVEKLIHEHSLETHEPDRNRLLRIAREIGLEARFTRLEWQELDKVGEAYPAMARLDNGNHVIIVGVHQDETGTVDQVAVFDPLAERPKDAPPDFLLIPREKFQAAWSGDLLLLKRSYSLKDEKQPFGFAWFIPEILRQRTVFLDVAIAAIFIYLVALATPLFFQIVIDKVLVNQAEQTLKVLGIGIVIALIFDALLDFLRNFLLLHATSKIDIRVAGRTFSHLLKLPVSFFDRISAGVLTKHMQQTATIREFLTGSLFLTLLDSFALLVFIPVLFFYSVELTFVVLAFSGAIALVIGVLIPPFRRRLKALYQAEGERQALLVESIHGMSTVKALSMEPVLRKGWENRAAQAVSMQYRVGKISITAQSFSKLLEKLMTVAVIWVGAQSVFDNRMTVGALIAFQMVAGRVSGPLVQIVSLIHSYQEAALSVRMLGAVMNEPEERGGVAGGLQPPLAGGIEFDKVTFRYAPDAPPSLDNISFEIPAGKVIGIVGRSGSGKTTLTRLLQGLYAPNPGIIRIDGYDLRELDLTYLRQAMGVVLQESFLFRGSIRENISMARTSATFDEVVRAARMAGADEFIQKMQQSYETPLEEGGTNLSGGQKQRLAIARALLTNPRILILDEATSALDPESERIIRANLTIIARGRTVIIVSHRLSTLVDSDGILVIDAGNVVGMGRHEQLLASCAIYGQLWKQQTG
uniref:ATP-binding cassette, subfamily B n=1 Tax=Candidatus Kentrum sp. LFY TaxID=2126342 RepID=A0A450V222_9GAMM|nr:MAG: ATP-binding cassette, subfamily B [Candidatus Kentron sp. LFY]